MNLDQGAFHHLSHGSNCGSKRTGCNPDRDGGSNRVDKASDLSGLAQAAIWTEWGFSPPKVCLVANPFDRRRPQLPHSLTRLSSTSSHLATRPRLVHTIYFSKENIGTITDFHILLLIGSNEHPCHMAQSSIVETKKKVVYGNFLILWGALFKLKIWETF